MVSTLAAVVDVELARSVAASVVDPEIPVLTIEELGILRGLTVEGGRIRVTITPTYSGCPAMRQIEDDLRLALSRAGFADAEVVIAHHPAWSTEWMTGKARTKLDAFGIAPPTPAEAVLCPRCRAARPRMVARFGSTACKALMVCSGCGEPFDYFKEY